MDVGSLTVMCIDLHLCWSSLFRVLWASCTQISICFLRLGIFKAIFIFFSILYVMNFFSHLLKILHLYLLFSNASEVLNGDSILSFVFVDSFIYPFISKDLYPIGIFFIPQKQIQSIADLTCIRSGNWQEPCRQSRRGTRVSYCQFSDSICPRVCPCLSWPC